MPRRWVHRTAGCELPRLRTRRPGRALGPNFFFFFLNAYTCALGRLAEEGVGVEVPVLFLTAEPCEIFFSRLLETC